ncbi:MAG: hypothetical protein B7Z06_08710 [Flavobacteriales bacterium 32-35-8]|nr:MAG: hypothetical protein B7Z06_08710 [Flavobacteriales bacterium 32-35-8]
MFSCEDRDEGWSKIFKLSDFGIKPNEQFYINSLQVALSESNTGAHLQFSIYSIDENFPVFFHSLYPRSALGTRGYGQAPLINGAPEIINVYFEEPIIVPAGTERILVTVHKSVDFYNPESARVVVAGTAEDTGESWYSGCDENYGLTKVSELNNPVPHANFYINVTGEAIDITNSGDILRLSNNVGDNLLRTNMFSCSSSMYYWARVFDLDEFGILTNEEYVINSGQVGISGSDGGASIKFNIYKIEGNFPDSFSESNLIGSSKSVRVPYISEHNPQIVNITFDEPIIIKPAVDKILVEVVREIVWGSGVMFIAGTEMDTDFSWYKGCGAYYDNYCNMKYITTEELGRPNGKFYINLTGNKNIVAESKFEIYTTSICSEFLKEFRVEKKENVASVVWNFGDPNSGADNISTDISPFHDFSGNGTYTVTARVTGNDGSVENLTQTIDVKEPPTAYGINNIYACEDIFNSGISTSFDVSAIEQQVLGGQVNKQVTYIDGAGNQYHTLPNPFTNTVKNRETITVRVSYEDNPCCYSETTFDLIVNSNNLNIDNIEDLEVCDDDYDGFTVFDLTQTESEIINGNSNLVVEFYHQDGELINSINTVNRFVNQEIITGKVTNINTNCSNEITFNVIVIPLPIANTLNEIIGCDDNNNGISEYFDTSNIESQVLGNQTGMEVSYFDVNGNPLPSPLPNPYTNTIPNEELITVRVTNPITTCFSETSVTLKAASQPQINQPQTIYACDLGNGYANFDLAHIETEITGNQSGLKITYFDSGNNQLPSPLPLTFRNAQAWSQTIYARVENELNSLCYSETSFNLIVNQLPLVSINDSYFLCNLEPSLSVSVESNFDTYNWEYQDGTIISSTYLADLMNAGNYTLTVGQNNNGIYCENSFDFKLIRSELPSIVNVEYKELSDDNYIKINASGDGDFEYSIDGNNYQSSNLFNNVSGGIYTVSVRDKLGCGEDFEEVIIIDYPKYFTPNGDGVNDTWQIKGMRDYPNAEIFIYDRYGKLLKQIFAQDEGWNGTFRGEKLTATDYWFTVKLNGSKTFTGHFALKR